VDPEKEQEYLHMVTDRPDLLCSEAPPEILEECASEAEPTKFHEEYFAAGYSEWLAQKHGRRINLPQSLIDRAILVLWHRATLLNTAKLLGQESEHANSPFFSDEGLY
jgi:hypothetical protein